MVKILTKFSKLEKLFHGPLFKKRHDLIRADIIYCYNFLRKSLLYLDRIITLIASVCVCVCVCVFVRVREREESKRNRDGKKEKVKEGERER